MSSKTITLNDPLLRLLGVGPKLAEKLAKFGVSRIVDLLFHLPLRYQDRTRITAIAQLKFGTDAVIAGTIINTQITFGRRRSLLCTIEDDSARLQLRMFHFSKIQQQALYEGRTIRCFG